MHFGEGWGLLGYHAVIKAWKMNLQICIFKKLSYIIKIIKEMCLLFSHKITENV